MNELKSDDRVRVILRHNTTAIDARRILAMVRGLATDHGGFNVIAGQTNERAWNQDGSLTFDFSNALEEICAPQLFARDVERFLPDWLEVEEFQPGTVARGG